MICYAYVSQYKRARICMFISAHKLWTEKANKKIITYAHTKSWVLLCFIAALVILLVVVKSHIHL